MKKTSYLLLSALAALSFLFVPLTTAYAASDPVDVFTDACKTNPDSLGCEGNKPATGSGIFGIIKNVIEVMLTIGGIVAVIMIIIGGIRYVTSNGEQAHVKGAKDTILYAVIGLVVTILAYSIVYYVTKNL